MHPVNSRQSTVDNQHSTINNQSAINNQQSTINPQSAFRNPQFTMYSTTLFLHSWIRWFAIIAVVGTTFAAVMGRVQSENSPADRWGLFAMTALDVQLLLGLLLYLVVSPNMAEIRAHFGEAMRTPQLRFWAVEHLSAMLGAVILAHVGRVLARKAATPQKKRARLIVCFGAATILIILGTPWPGMPAGRPLFRV